MKTCMMLLLAVMGLVPLLQAAEMKPGAGRVRVEYPDPAKKCEGLNGDARRACLESVKRQSRTVDSAGPVPPAPETAK